MLDKLLANPERFSSQGADARVLDALTDEELLKRFTQRQEEAAFAALLRRHGPMVLSVCRRTLHHSHDVEDAFQATFLVMVEKGHRLRRPELLANWLYGVAFRTALHARQRASRRREHERKVAATSSNSVSHPEVETTELRRVLDEELHSLPEKYRTPLVLCYLEGKTNEEAARLLGWPSGSMSYRLARGRELLRERLQARLAGASVFLSGALLADQLRPAPVSPCLTLMTVQGAMTLAGAKISAPVTGFVSSSVQYLMQATLRSLASSSRRWWLTVCFLGLTLSSFAGAGVWVGSGFGTSSSQTDPFESGRVHFERWISHSNASCPP